MEPINKLTEEKKTDIQCSCISFFLGYNKSNKLKGVFNHLFKDIGINKSVDEVWVFVTCLAKANKQSTRYSKFTRNKDHYTTTNRRFGFSISHYRMMKVLDALEAKDYIKIYKGMWRSNGEGMTTVIEFTEKVIELVDGINLTKYCNSIKDTLPVEVRDSATKEVLNHNRLFRGINLLGREVEKYNAVLGNYNIKLGSHDVVTQYKRVFSDDLTGAGRWYCGTFQTLPSKYRSQITFDSEVTVELDVTAIHPSINACLLGTTIPDGFDPYKLDINIYGEAREIRNLSKQGMMCVLYAKDRVTAIASLSKHYREDCVKHKRDREYSSINYEEGMFTNVIDSLIKHNSYISDNFFIENGWKRLQHIDSEICRYVINKFIDRDKCILCYHDSFIVAESDKDLLQKSIEDGWYKVLCTRNNLRLEEK